MFDRALLLAVIFAVSISTAKAEGWQRRQVTSPDPYIGKYLDWLPNSRDLVSLFNHCSSIAPEYVELCRFEVFELSSNIGKMKGLDYFLETPTTSGTAELSPKLKTFSRIVENTIQKFQDVYKITVTVYR